MPKKISALRWWIAVLLLGAAVLNYVDRQTLSALAPTVEAALGINDRDYAHLVNLFLLAYTLSYLVVGRLTDRWGARVAMTSFVVWWSLSNALTAAAVGVRSLGAFRFSLGLSEAGVWPAASKAVSEWFPARERALAIGIYTMGATVGATVAPYLVIPLTRINYAAKFPLLYSWLGVGAGWRMAFILTGAAGFIWLIFWWTLYCPPEDSARITDEEKKIIFDGRANDDTSAEPAWTWRKLLTSRVIWALMFGRLVTDPVWYFYQFWFPKYLHNARGVSQSQLTLTWVVYAAAGLGSLTGGWWSGRLIRQHRSAASARLWVMLGCAVVMPISPLIAAASGLNSALVLSAVVVFAALAWLINISALVNDLIPSRSLATAFSLIAAGSTIGGMVMNTLVAAMVSGTTMPTSSGFLDQAINSVLGGLLGSVQGKGYALAFLMMAFLHPLALLWLWGLRRTKNIP